MANHHHSHKIIFLLVTKRKHYPQNLDSSKEHDKSEDSDLTDQKQHKYQDIIINR